MNMHNSTTQHKAFNTYDDSEEDTKLSEVRSCFKKETGGLVRCLLCRITVPDHEEDIRRHMEKHPKLLNEQQDLDVLLQDDDDEQQDAFTEVVYLDEENITLPKTTEKNKWQDTPRKRKVRETLLKSIKKRKKCVSSTSGDETIVKTEKYSEISKFGDYIMCLLEKLPHDVCMKLQMNIINMIMNANLSNTSSSVVEPVTIQPIPPEYYVLEKNVDKSQLQRTSTESASTRGNQSYSITITPSTAADSVPNDVTNSD